MKQIDFLYETFGGFYMSSRMFDHNNFFIFGLSDSRGAGGIKSFTRPGFTNYAAVERSSEMWKTKR